MITDNYIPDGTGLRILSAGVGIDAVNFRGFIGHIGPELKATLFKSGTNSGFIIGIVYNILVNHHILLGCLRYIVSVAIYILDIHGDTVDLTANGVVVSDEFFEPFFNNLQALIHKNGVFFQDKQRCPKRGEADIPHTVGVFIKNRLQILSNFLGSLATHAVHRRNLNTVFGNILSIFAAPKMNLGPNVIKAFLQRCADIEGLDLHIGCACRSGSKAHRQKHCNY